MFENFICECPFCKEAAKWPKHNPYTEHNAHEEAVRAALHQAERDNVIKDEIIEDLRKKLAKSEEKHKKATKMVKVLMKERESMITCLHNRIEKVDELLVKNAELKKMNASQRHIIDDSGYISMSEYNNAIKERNVYKSKCTTYERLYDDVCKKYDELKKEKDELNDLYKMTYDRSDELLKANKEFRHRIICETSNREYFQNKFYDKCKECDRLAAENEKLSHRIPVVFRVENGGIDLQTFVPKAKYDTLEQKHWDAQRLIDKYAQSEEKTKEYLNALTKLYFDECVKTHKDCPLFEGFRGGKIFGDHGNTGDGEML